MYAALVAAMPFELPPAGMTTSPPTTHVQPTLTVESPPGSRLTKFAEGTKFCSFPDFPLPLVTHRNPVTRIVITVMDEDTT